MKNITACFAKFTSYSNIAPCQTKYNGLSNHKFLPLIFSPILLFRYPASIQPAVRKAIFDYLKQNSVSFYQRLFCKEFFCVQSFHVLKRVCIEGCRPFFLSRQLQVDSEAWMCCHRPARKLKQCSSVNRLCLPMLAATAPQRVHRQYATLYSPQALSTPAHSFQICHLSFLLLPNSFSPWPGPYDISFFSRLWGP